MALRTIRSRAGAAAMSVVIVPASVHHDDRHRQPDPGGHVPHLDRDGDVLVLTLGGDENRFAPDRVAVWNELLDEVERAEGPRALVTRGEGKFWSNGLDLEWFAAHPDGADAFLGEVHRLLARVLVLPVPTVAAITGHAFAAGAMLAVAHDAAVMRADRGYWCLPEVDIGLPFSPGMQALLVARLAPRTAHEAMATGRRFAADDALAAGIVDATAAEDDVVATAVARAAALAHTAGPTLGRIKAQLHGPAAEVLRTAPVRFGGPGR
jgi:enoyl-CoA hydratase/carnithine racemase